MQSPRVLHLATHGFYLPDQEFRRTNAAAMGLEGGWGQVGRLPYVRSDWENPLVRCGIALAGANHAGQITNALAEDGILTGLEASLLNLQGTEAGHPEHVRQRHGRGEDWRGGHIAAPGLPHRRRADGAGEPLEGERQGHQPIDDGVYGALAGGGAAGAGVARGAVVPAPLKDFASPYFWAAFTLTGQWR